MSKPFVYAIVVVRVFDAAAPFELEHQRVAPFMAASSVLDLR